MAQTINSQTIGKSQVKLLASGFLDTLGSRAEFSDLILDETLASLILIAGNLINRANENLTQRGHIGSGLLKDSHKIRNPHYQGQEIHLDIEALFYYAFLDKGVSGTKSGSGLYSFKSDFPSREMVKSIQAWIISGRKVSSIPQKKSISNYEIKQRRISDYDKAYAVARSIKMKGIRATGYFDSAIDFARNQTLLELGKALKLDIIRSLPSQV
jgi:hypothetical protein